MSPAIPLDDPSRRPKALPSLRIWHLGLLVAFVAFAIFNIQDQRITDPALVGLAAGGFVGFGVIAAAVWPLFRRLERPLGALAALLLYLVAMGAFFLVATIVYLVVEWVYVNGLH